MCLPLVESPPPSSRPVQITLGPSPRPPQACLHLQHRLFEHVDISSAPWNPQTTVASGIDSLTYPPLMCPRGLCRVSPPDACPHRPAGVGLPSRASTALSTSLVGSPVPAANVTAARAPSRRELRPRCPGARCRPGGLCALRRPVPSQQTPAAHGLARVSRVMSKGGFPWWL